jgi:mRNA-degrading endonuclease toxin of MazEF toxin-antitoxin module
MSVAGEVVQALLPQRVPGGHEQSGARPCIVVGDFSPLGSMRYPMVLVVPLTSVNAFRVGWASPYPRLYPRLQAGSGAGAVAVDSFALLDQLTALDAGRVVGSRGSLTLEELQPLLDGLREAIGS